jgi:flagellin
MVQISVASGRSLQAVESAVAGAGRLAEVVQSVASGRGGSSDSGDASVFGDRQHVVASSRFAVEAQARSAANLNASEASSLLQTADDALVSIRKKLDRLGDLAVASEAGDRSAFERSQYEVEFQAIKTDIDAVASMTVFDNTQLLKGGSGAGGEFEVSFKVGTGNAESDEITVTIAPAAVSDLSAALVTDNVATQADATATKASVNTALDVVDTIRAGIAGNMERFSIAARNNATIGQASQDARAALTNPTVAIDLSRFVATRVAEEGGFDLTEDTADRVRQLLIQLDKIAPDTRRPERDTERDSTATPPAKSSADKAEKEAA